MTDQEARYDRIAEGYAAWWAPVHRPGTLGLLVPELSNPVFPAFAEARETVGV